MAVNINFGAINVNAMTRDGTVSVGENNQTGWSAHGKQNIGNGFFYGMNFTTNSMNNIIDNDIVDDPVNDQDGIPSNQNQTL
ncbi:hypothetical protein JOD45_000052 [Scopulibacillus daqui]|uniref:Spore germination protein GerPA/GerPF n=1 Tax=Scopulibacillus daqui TaxID=1469162 RepID=A0ABS2PUY0_9BACL|nr:spore germination protein [Scopulibacillus daqui]MBM7643861.1 hypothetical protein [Scopulibacillus daqui]